MDKSGAGAAAMVKQQEVETWNDAAQILSSLSESLSSFAWNESTEACIELIQRLDKANDPFPEKIAKAVLTALRRKRQFQLMELVADAFIRNGQSASQVYMQYAQAFIDQGSVTAAAMILESIVNDVRTSIAEKAEASGLMGRVYKQQYVTAKEPDNPRQKENLIQAIYRYYDVYKTNPAAFHWHGINTVALLARAVRDQIPVSLPVTDKDITSQIEQLVAKDTLDQWESATAVESAVALGRFSDAYERCLLFLSNPAVDAFEISSLLRQLTEVWELSDDREPGSNLLPALRATLLKREGGQVALAVSTVHNEDTRAARAQTTLEKVFGADKYEPLAWYRTGLQRCSAVGQVETVTGRKIGSGFLVKAQDFFPKRADGELLFLTNAHVISVTEGIDPNAARVQFEATGVTCDVADVIWSSPVSSLDATFVSLKNLAATSEICPLTPAPKEFTEGTNQRVYVIGYPKGGGLSFSLQDSAWLDADNRVMHYRTPTEPGSSGSPVFDQDYWTVVALHHAGQQNMPKLNGKPGTYDANEGIAISAIRAQTTSG